MKRKLKESHASNCWLRKRDLRKFKREEGEGIRNGEISRWGMESKTSDCWKNFKAYK